MAEMKFTRSDPEYPSHIRWRDVCCEDHYAVVPPSELRGLMADGLLDKANNVVVMSAASGPYTVVVANVNRVDLPASSVDQNPYIAVYDHAASSASGGYLHHGDWDGRSDTIDPMLMAGIAVSGISAYYPIGHVPLGMNGALSDLAVNSQNTAFWVAFRELRRGSIEPGDS